MAQCVAVHMKQFCRSHKDDAALLYCMQARALVASPTHLEQTTETTRLQPHPLYVTPFWQPFLWGSHMDASLGQPLSLL
jgi:hypothetical protein